jgi:hypothetical protein
MLAIPDDKYRAIKARKPPYSRCGITIRSTADDAPLFMVLRTGTGTPLCGITPLTHQEYLRARSFQAVVVQPGSRTKVGMKTGTVQRITEGIPAIVQP